MAGKSSAQQYAGSGTAVLSFLRKLAYFASAPGGMCQGPVASAVSEPVSLRNRNQHRYPRTIFSMFTRCGELIRHHAAKFLLLPLFLASCGWTQNLHVEGPQQEYVEDDAAFDKAQPLSRELLFAMLRTSMSAVDARWVLSSTPAPGAPGSLFRAIPVRLNQAKPRWLLAVGTAIQTTGADNGHFWLVDPTKVRPQAYMLAPANSVKLLSTAHTGFSDVEASWCSANECLSTTYSFIHGHYRKVRKRYYANEGIRH